MTAWWNSLTIFQQILACMAIPATLVLILQTVLMLLGIGGGHDADVSEDADVSGLDGHDADIDHAGDGRADGHEATDHDHAHSMSGLRLLTVRGLVAFFAVGGWLGIVLSKGGLSSVLTAVLALAGGIAAMALIAVILRLALRLQEQGNISLDNAIHQTAQVYITIPPNRSAPGKVTLTVQERYLELEAITDADDPIKTGESVYVTGLAGEGVLLVAPIEMPKTVIRLQL